MKPTFRKGAVLLASAMVISSAAPATSFVYAAKTFTYAYQTGGEVSEHSMEIGESVDLRFLGVNDYKNYSRAWVSSNPEVATVDINGVVTAKANGTTVITLRVGDGSVYTSEGVVVTVGELPAAETNKEFSAHQTSDSIVTLTFENKDITATELENGLSFYYYVGDVKISYPIKVESVKNGVATLSSYVTFTDGTRYGFTYGEESAEFVASIGEVASIRYSWKCDGDEYKAYAGTDTTISYQLLNAKGVDITSTAMSRSGASVSFNLVKESETGDFWISDSTEGKIFFNTEGAIAQVEIEYITGQYDNETYEPIPGPKTVATIVSSKAPAYGINVAAGGTATIVKNAAAAGDSIDWKKASNVIALGDDEKNEFRLVAKLTDTKGETVYTDTMDAEKGTFSFATTNNAIMYVEEDGYLMTNNTGTVNVLVYFTPAEATSASVVAVLPVTVRPARAISSITLDKTSDIISTESGNGFNQTTFKVTLKDQLGDPIAGELDITSNLKNLPNGVTAIPEIGAVEGADGEYTFTVTGSQENLPNNANGYAYSFTVAADNLKKTFNVTVKKPSTDKNGNLVISGYKIEFTGDDDLKTTDEKAKTATATLYLLSNGVKAQVAELSKKETSVSNMKAGNYYYTVSKGSNSIETTVTDNTSVQIPLTAIAEKEIDGATINVVDKKENGSGVYTVTIYKGIGSTTGATASALSQVSRNTLTVKDSQDSLTYAGKRVNSFDSTEGGVEELVKSNFKFKLGETILDDSSDYGNIKLVVNANRVDEGGALKPGSVCYVKSVDFYVETAEGSNTFVKHTVKVNDYVEVK